MPSDIALLINDNLYGGWKSASIDLSIESLSGTFNLTLTDRWAKQLNPAYIRPLDACQVLIDGQSVITGYVDVVNPAIDATSHTIQVMGRDKACDLIDCSIVTGTGQYKNLKVEQIIGLICQPFNIGVACDIDTGLPLDTFNIEQGSTAIDAIQKLAYARQCLVMSDGQGGILITRAGTQKSSSQLVQGENILRGNATYDFSQRFSQYVVKGQMQGTDNSTPDVVAGNMAVIKDGAVTRYRPLAIVADGQASNKDCSTRGTWELNTRKGRSRRFSISVQSWLQEDGQLWHLNQLVFLESAILGSYDDLLISGINFAMDASGQITTLSLTSKDAYLILETPTLDPVQNPWALDTTDEVI